MKVEPHGSCGMQLDKCMCTVCTCCNTGAHEHCLCTAWPPPLCVQVEMLLENYAQELGAATSLLELLAYSIESDEKFFSYRLDSVAHMHRIVHRIVHRMVYRMHSMAHRIAHYTFRIGFRTTGYSHFRMRCIHTPHMHCVHRRATGCSRWT